MTTALFPATLIAVSIVSIRPTHSITVLIHVMPFSLSTFSTSSVNGSIQTSAPIDNPTSRLLATGSNKATFAAPANLAN